MKIIIDTEEVEKLGISYVGYLYLFLAVNKLPLDSEHFAFNCLYELEKKGYVKYLGDQEYSLRQEAFNLFTVTTPEQKFLEFWNNYPIKVPNAKGGGYRVLKAKDPDSKQGQEIKKKYLKLINKPGIHEQIIEGLDVYLREMRDKLSFLQGVDVFLNQQTWEKYIDLRDIEEGGFTNDI